MKSKRTHFILTDHICRHCAGGRILQAVSGVGPTGGGNPLYQCSECGKAGAAMETDHLCWCGWHYKGSTENPYMCASKKDHPEWQRAFEACGCWNARTEVGVVLRDNIRNLEREKK